MSNGTVAHDPSAPYDGAPPQRSWGGEEYERHRSGALPAMTRLRLGLPAWETGC